MADDLFYRLVSARYQQFERNLELKAKKKAKEAPFKEQLKQLKDQLATLNDEKDKVLERIISQQADASDFARYQQIMGEIAEIMEKIQNINAEMKEKTKAVRRLINVTKKEVENYDKIISPLCVTNRKLQVEEPVKAALEAAEAGRLDEASLMIKVVVHEEGAAAATGGRRGL